VLEILLGDTRQLALARGVYAAGDPGGTTRRIPQTASGFDGCIAVGYCGSFRSGMAESGEACDGCKRAWTR
jgi:hypothetical protein